jgi:hypothetical protein
MTEGVAMVVRIDGAWASGALKLWGAAMRWLVLAILITVVACAAPQRMSPRQAAYNELKKGMNKREVANILRGNRRVRVVQMGDPSDPSDDLEYWYYSADADNDFVVFTFEGKLLEWEYRDPMKASN